MPDSCQPYSAVDFNHTDCKKKVLLLGPRAHLVFTFHCLARYKSWIQCHKLRRRRGTRVAPRCLAANLKKATDPPCNSHGSPRCETAEIQIVMTMKNHIVDDKIFQDYVLDHALVSCLKPCFLNVNRLRPTFVARDRLNRGFLICRESWCFDVFW